VNKANFVGKKMFCVLMFWKVLWCYVSRDIDTYIDPRDFLLAETTYKVDNN